MDVSEAPERHLRTQVMRRGILERRRITQRLRHALGNDGLTLHYQPQHDLRLGLPRGAEAMIRLAHRRRGLLLPSHFMPIAERSDIIHDITGWMLDAACAEAAKWPQPLLIAVSLSAQQLRSARLIKFLIEALSHASLPAERLELGLTEAVLIDDRDDMIFNLKALRGLGIRLAIDDFGTGYASLSALQRLPLHTLRLDRSLIQNLGMADHNPSLLNAAVRAGHALGCSVLADGVETEAQVLALRELGCDQGQGSYFGPPMAAESLRQALLPG